MRFYASFISLAAGLFLVSSSAFGRPGKVPDYSVDKSFDLNAGSRVVYMGTDSKNIVWALLSSGEVISFNSKGEVLKRFKVDLKGRPASLAVDSKDNLTVLFVEYERKEFKSRGRKFVRMVPVSVNYSLITRKGKVKETGVLNGVRSANAARYSKRYLVIADSARRCLEFYDMKAKKIKRSVNRGIRLCCGIFDFWVDPDGSIMVASLAAFKVLFFKSSGRGGKAVGKRGRGIADFHGCCNPVSVARLPDKSIVTVEKDTTRIKIYDPKMRTAKVIEGVKELVKGCAHIPLAVDSEGDLYLASNKGDLIKCVRK